MDNTSPMNTLSVVEEEAANVANIAEAFPPHVDTTNIVVQPESPTSKKQTLKTFAEVNALLQAGKKREVKLMMRDNAWPLNNRIRAQLWPALCNQHAHGKNMLDGFYWDMVNQVFGTTGWCARDSPLARDLPLRLTCRCAGCCAPTYSPVRRVAHRFPRRTGARKPACACTRRDRLGNPSYYRAACWWCDTLYTPLWCDARLDSGSDTRSPFFCRT